MNITTLKLIGCILMTIDHMGQFFPETPIFFRWIGRMAYPIFAFCTAQGIAHTKSKRNYLLRLYVFGLAMSIMTFLLNIAIKPMDLIQNNIFSTLFSIVLLVSLLEYRKINKAKWIKYLIFYIIYQIISFTILYQIDNYFSGAYVYLMEGFFGNIFANEGKIVFVLLGLIFYYTRDNKKKLSICYIIFCLTYFVICISDVIPRFIRILSSWGYERLCEALNFIFGIMGFNTIFVGYDSIIFVDFQWMMIGALPFILFYNEQKGKGYKYFFYLYYPLHILVLVLIRNF